MRIVFADSHTLVRETIGDLLFQLDRTVEVVQARDVNDAISKGSRGPTPDLIVLDLFMPGMGGFAGLERVRRTLPRVPVVILSGWADPDDAQGAVSRGAAAYVPKTVGSRKLLDIFRRVVSGGTLPPASLIVNAENASAGPRPTADGSRPGPLAKLSQREREVAAELVAGHPNKVIAYHLGVVEITVKVHLNGIYRKLGVTNRSQAVRRIIESDLDFATRERLSAWIRPSRTFGLWAGPEISRPAGAA